jgi:hypothetical protein
MEAEALLMLKRKQPTWATFRFLDIRRDLEFTYLVEIRGSVLA